MNLRWLKKLGVAVAIGVLIFLAYEVAHHLWGHHFVLRTLDFVIVSLASRSGLSPFLVKGLVILLTIPFFWAVAKYTHGLFWLRGVGPSLRLYRNPYGLIIVGYAGLFFIAMYFASREAYAYKWCAETPEGIKTFDGAGKDPVYGVEASPCTLEQIVKIKEGEGKVIGAQRIQIGDAKQFAFFDSITKNPKVWYHRSPDGSYEFYDRPGKHPGTGNDLRPIDQETRQELIRLQDLHAAQLEQQELQSKQQASMQAAAEKQREHGALLERYVNTAISKRSGTKTVAVLILPEGSDSFSTVERTLVSILSKQGTQPVVSAFKPRFAQEGRARRLLAGDWNEATQLDLGKRLDYVISGLASVTYVPSSQFEGLITANLQVDLKCLNVVSQMVCGSQTISQTGAGYTNASALETAATNAKPQLEAFVKTLQLD